MRSRAPMWFLSFLSFKRHRLSSMRDVRTPYSTPNDIVNWFSLESRDTRRSSDLPRRSKSWVDSEFLNLRPKQKQSSTLNNNARKPYNLGG